MPRPRRVYYSASRCNGEDREFNRSVLSMIHDLGYSTWFPQEDASLPSDLIDNNEMSLVEAHEHIFRLSIRQLQSADIVVLVIDGQAPDADAGIAAGIAWAMNKPVVALRTNVDDDAGGSNTMVDGIVSDVAKSIEELRSLLAADTIVDLTGEDPVVTVGLRTETAPELSSDPAPDPGN